MLLKTKVVIEARNLNYLNILTKITLTWRQGERLALMGANGSGKSTLAKVLAGRLPFTSGELTLTKGNERLTLTKSQEDTGKGTALWQEVGLIGQHPRSQIIGATVGEELAFALVNRGYRQQEIHDRVKETLLRLGLEGREHESPSVLSGGERQRLVAAAVMLTHSPFLIFDESLSMLDLNAQRKTYEFIAQEAEGVGQLWITHDPQLAVRQDRLILIKDGQIVEEGSPSQILWDEERCAQFGISPLQEIPRKENFKSSLSGVHANADNKANVKDAKPVVTWKNATFVPGIDLNSTVYEQEFIAVVGSSGSGKSTLLESILGLRKPVTGTVEVSKGIVASLLLQEAGEYLIGSTVYHEVFYLNDYANDYLNDFANYHDTFYKDYLKSYDLKEVTKTPPEYLSGGQRQNVALAAALSNQPSLVLLDEPLLGLDRKKREESLEKIRQLKEDHQATIIYVTHDLGEVLQLADRIWLMKDGQIILDCEAVLWENYSSLWNKAGVRIPGKTVFEGNLNSSKDQVQTVKLESKQTRATVNKTIDPKNDQQVNPKSVPKQGLATIDPRLKLISLMILALMVSFSPLTGLILSSAAILGLMAITPRRIIPWRSISCIITGLAIFYAMLLGWEGYSGFRFWEGHFSIEGLEEAGFITWKIALIFSLTLLLISTTSYVEQGLAIHWILTPILKWTKSGDFALLLMLTLRFIPFFKEEALHLWKARRVKGPLPSSRGERIKEIARLALPLLKLTLKRAEEVSETLLGRGYDSRNYRIHSYWRWERRDNYSLVLMVCWVLILGVFTLMD